MNKILLFVILICSLTLFSQEQSNIEQIKTELLELEIEEFKNSPRPPLPVDSKEPKVNMQILDKYFISDFNQDGSEDYIFRLKGRKYMYLKNESPFYFKNILLEVDNNQITKKSDLPNSDEILKVDEVNIIFKNQTLVFKNGDFYNLEFWNNKNDSKYKYTQRPLLKNTKNSVSSNGLEFFETGIFDDATFRINGVSKKENSVEIKIFFDSTKEYKEQKDKNILIKKFISYLNSNLDNQNNSSWFTDLKNKTKQITNKEVQRIEPWNGLKYALKDGFNAHIYFLTQSYYDDNNKELKVPKLVIELTK